MRQRDKQISTDGLGVNFLTKVVVIKLQKFFKVKGIDFPSLEISISVPFETKPYKCLLYSACLALSSEYQNTGVRYPNSFLFTVGTDNNCITAEQ